MDLIIFFNTLFGFFTFVAWAISALILYFIFTKKRFNIFRGIYFSNHIYWNTKILCYVRYRSNWRKLIKLWIYNCITNTKRNVCLQNSLQRSSSIIRNSRCWITCINTKSTCRIRNRNNRATTNYIS